MTPDSDCVSPFVDGFLAGALFSKLQIVTGTTKTLVNAKCVPKSAYLGRSITLGSRTSRQLFKHQLAKLKITVGEVSVNAEVAVDEQLPCSAFLGLDLGPAMTAKLTGIVADRAKAALIISESEVPKQSECTVVPKQSDSKVVTKQQVNFEVTRTQSECEPVALAVVLDSPAAYPEPGAFSGIHESVDELELDQSSPKADDTPVILGNVFEFSDELFSSDSPVDLGEVFDFSDSLFEPEDPVPTPVQVLEVCPVEESGSSCFSCNNSDVEVILREDCVAVQPLDDLFDFSDSSVGYDSLVGLGDVLDIVDQLFVPVDPVPTPVTVFEVYPDGRTDIECPLPLLKVGGTGGTCIIGKARLEEVNFVEDSLVVQPPAHLICVRMEENILDCSDSVNLVEECVVGLPPVDFVSVANEAFGSVVLHSPLDGMAENLGSAADPLGEKQVELVKSQGLGGTPVLVVPSVDACTENYDVFDEGYQKIYVPGAMMLVGLRSSSRSETLCMVSVTPDKSVSVWSISYPYRVMDRGKNAKSEGFGSSVRMGAACHGFCAWAAALQSLETRCLHLGPLEFTKATRDSFSDEVSWVAFILLTVISVFECVCALPLFTIPTTDWAEISMSGATCVSPMAVLCAVEKQEQQLAVFFLILVQLFIVYQRLLLPMRVPLLFSLPVSPTAEGGGDVMESPSLTTEPHNI